MEFILAGLLYLVILFYIVRRGHREAVKQSELRLREHFARQGEAGEPARKLMREAGYDV